MTEIQIRIPQNQPELEAAILQFVQEEFQQTAQFENEPASDVTHKDGSALELLFQILVIIATIDGAINFAQRAQRLERVKKLKEVIQRIGKPVYIKIKGKFIDLYQKSVDEIMNLLAGDDEDDDD